MALILRKLVNFNRENRYIVLERDAEVSCLSSRAETTVIGGIVRYEKASLIINSAAEHGSYRYKVELTLQDLEKMEWLFQPVLSTKVKEEIRAYANGRNLVSDLVRAGSVTAPAIEAIRSILRAATNTGAPKYEGTIE